MPKIKGWKKVNRNLYRFLDGRALASIEKIGKMEKWSKNVRWLPCVKDSVGKLELPRTDSWHAANYELMKELRKISKTYFVVK